MDVKLSPATLFMLGYYEASLPPSLWAPPPKAAKVAAKAKPLELDHDVTVVDVEVG